MKCALTALMLVAAAALPLTAHAQGVLLKVEAEDWADQGGGDVVVLEREGASGGKTVSYWEDRGVWVELAFDVPVAAEYVISLGYALSWGETRRLVTVDGEDVGDAVLPTTGGWDAFSKATLDLGPVRLEPGRRTVRFTNVDSVGLSLDWVALHTTDVHMSDRVVGERERARILETLEATAAQQRARTLELGRVRVDLNRAGEPVLARLGDAVLALPPSETEIRAAMRLHETARHRVLVARRGTGPDRLVLIWITDGSSLHVVAVADRPIEAPLPGPVMAADGRRIVLAETVEGAAMNFAAREGPSHATAHLTAGDVHVTAAPALVVGPWEGAHVGVPQVRLRLRPWQGRYVGAARISLRWGRDEPAVHLSCAPEGCVVREAARRYPTLVRFYDGGMFDLRLKPDGSVEFHDVGAGETVGLLGPTVRR